MVYVDNFNARYRGMTMCHMFADTTDELIAMVDKVGVQRRWIQDKGTYSEHFDICLAKKKLAITAGAKEVNMRDFARFCNARANESNCEPALLAWIRREPKQSDNK